GILDQLQDFEQRLMLGVLPDDLTGFAHPLSLDPNSGIFHDYCQTNSPEPDLVAANQWAARPWPQGTTNIAARTKY
ncbi:MAG: hypothetical protein OET63_19405, partial [Desulfobacterales bacterium]|nr:hypothetical protein [Desulfobacterales bacterium]